MYVFRAFVFCVYMCLCVCDLCVFLCVCVCFRSYLAHTIFVPCGVAPSATLVGDI